MHKQLSRREESEQIIGLLEENYPACFFSDPRHRRPLKKTIIADLLKDNFQVEPGMVMQAVEWYESHIKYHTKIQAGVKRIDLNGKEVETVTESEQRKSEQYIRESRQRKIEQSSPTEVMRQMNANRQVPDDALRKIDAPPRTAQKKTMPIEEIEPNEEEPSSQLASVQTPLDFVSKIMNETPNRTLRNALAVAGLQVVRAEVDKLIVALATASKEN